MVPNKNHAVLELLRKFECRNTTFIDPDGSWPIVWEKARGCFVWDANGRRYLDVTSAFAVANAGHANPRVVAAGQKQMARLLHAMGDVHPHALKATLARELSRITFERWKSGTGKTLFCNSGFEAVEAALKTAQLYTGNPRVLVFTGSYHGLGYGALNVTHREEFRKPFQSQLKRFGTFVPFPKNEADVRALEKPLRSTKWGAVLVEPVQGRGGIHVPPKGFLPALKKEAARSGALLIFDEIMTGFGRTGEWFACDHSTAKPDILCLGKALTGGFPLSACVGRADVMDKAWPVSTGEALHTSTFLGHPVGCAMALAQIKEIKSLLTQARRLGKKLGDQLKHLAKMVQGAEARGVGMMWGLALRKSDGQPDGERSLRVVRKLLERGFIFLPEGERGEVIGCLPPLTISDAQLSQMVRALEKALLEDRS